MVMVVVTEIVLVVKRAIFYPLFQLKNRSFMILTASCRWIFFGSPYNNYLARIPKRLRYASHQKTSAGVKFVQNIFRNLLKIL